jgi:hypothetical protein
MATIADELNAISVEHGYTGAAPKTIAGAIDALADTLAGTDVEGKRTIAGAIHALAPYIGGGGTRVELFDETVTTEDEGGYASAILAFTGDTDADPLVVTFDGMEYELPRSEAEDMMGRTVTYGTPLTESTPDFSTYPLTLVKFYGIGSGSWRAYTETAGTYTIAAYTE